MFVLFRHLSISSRLGVTTLRAFMTVFIFPQSLWFLFRFLCISSDSSISSFVSCHHLIATSVSTVVFCSFSIHKVSLYRCTVYLTVSGGHTVFLLFSFALCWFLSLGNRTFQTIFMFICPCTQSLPCLLHTIWWCVVIDYMSSGLCNLI